MELILIRRGDKIVAGVVAYQIGKTYYYEVSGIQIDDNTDFLKQELVLLYIGSYLLRPNVVVVERLIWVIRALFLKMVFSNIRVSGVTVLPAPLQKKNLNFSSFLAATA